MQTEAAGALSHLHSVCAASSGALPFPRQRATIDDASSANTLSHRPSVPLMMMSPGLTVRSKRIAVSLVQS